MLTAGILTFFKWLQHGKQLRGTAFDLFGYSAERKREREWIKRYESDVEEALDKLSAATFGSAKDLLSIPSQIRGYGIVKHEAMILADAARVAALESLHEAAAADRTKAA